MARKVIEEVQKAPDPTPTPVKTFDVFYDEDKGELKFNLSDGTLVEMRSPTAKILLLLESWYQNPKTSEDYKSTSFLMMKVASLCITKFGDKDKVTFDEFVDKLSIEDLERVVKAVACFRDFFEYLQRRGGDTSSESAAISS